MDLKRAAVAVLTLAVLAGLLSACASTGSTQTAWPTLDSGKPAFYYFGAPS